VNAFARAVISIVVLFIFDSLCEKAGAYPA